MKQIRTVTKLDDQLWVIDEQQKVSLFILEGEYRVLLIDTGSGLLNLRDEIKKLCGDKTITVINTHAHIDHISGNNQFPEVLVGKLDSEELNYPKEKYETCDEIAYFREGISKEEASGWKPGPTKRIRTVQEGDILELGGLTVRIIEVPSHTMGSIALYVEERGWLFTGDIVLPWEVWGWLSNSASLEQYLRSIEKLLKQKTNVRRIFPSHGQEKMKIDGYSRYELPLCVLDIYHEGIGDILEKRYEYELFEYVGKVHGRESKNIEKRKVSFAIGGIIFDPDKL